MHSVISSPLRSPSTNGSVGNPPQTPSLICKLPMRPLLALVDEVTWQSFLRSVYFGSEQRQAWASQEEGNEHALLESSARTGCCI